MGTWVWKGQKNSKGFGAEGRTDKILLRGTRSRLIKLCNSTPHCSELAAPVGTFMSIVNCKQSTGFKNLNWLSERWNIHVHNASSGVPNAAAPICARGVPSLPAGPRYSLQVHRSSMSPHLPCSCCVWVGPWSCFLILNQFNHSFFRLKRLPRFLWNRRSWTAIPTIPDADAFPASELFCF